MRSMGRRESDASPMSVKVPGCAASRPDIMRIVDPELPQSSGVIGRSDAAAYAVNCNAAVIQLAVTVAPRACMQARVDAQSAPVEKLVNREVPSANAPSMP